MKVRELIEELKKHDPDLEVVISDVPPMEFPATDVSLLKSGDTPRVLIS